MRPREELPATYVRSCEKFFKELSLKHQASSTKHQAPGPEGAGNFKKK